MEDQRRMQVPENPPDEQEQDIRLDERLKMLQHIREDLKRQGEMTPTDHITKFLSWICVFTGFALISSVVWNRFVVDFAAPWVALPHITAVQMMCLKWLINYFSPFHK